MPDSFRVTIIVETVMEFVMPLDHLPRGVLSRLASGGRVAGALATAAARRLGGGDQEALGQALGDRLVGELDRMKGMAMKVGQILSTVESGLPESTTLALARLQRGAQPLAPAAIARVVEEALGAPPEVLFDAWRPEPVAAASIGQVHRARFEGQEVAVKVRYPGVREAIEADLGPLGAVASLASLATSVDGAALVAEMRERFGEECDYRREAAWLAAVGPHLPAGVEVPRVFPARCAETVLTTAWVDGHGVADGVSADVGRRLLATGWHTLLRSGFLHADPHPGNYLVRPDGALVLLDWGCVRRVGAAEVEPVRALVRAVVDGDRPGYERALAASGLVGDPRFDVGASWDTHRWLLAPYLAPSYTFGRGWMIEGARWTGPTAPNQRYMSLPPLWVWLLRQVVGAHTTLGRLGLRVEARSDLLASLDAPLAPLADPCGG